MSFKQRDMRSPSIKLELILLLDTIGVYSLGTRDPTMICLPLPSPFLCVKKNVA